ncbi:YrhB domain-containing protein [Actinoplanes sp. CA-054009]
MITRERAIEMVTERLKVERRIETRLPELVVDGVAEHELGWVMGSQSAEYVRTGHINSMLLGTYTYLVDRQDGSLHRFPMLPGVWKNLAQMYREQVKGVKPPDPLLDAVREVLGRDGVVAALRHLRKRAPWLGLAEVKTYVGALRDGREPDEELAQRARPEPEWVPPRIETIAR